ncbi:MAG: hypothetical protein V3575_03145 [Candidatus Absconditabacteria bacterium]
MEVSQIHNYKTPNNKEINNKVKNIVIPIVLSLVLNFAGGESVFAKEQESQLLKGEVLKQQIQEYINKKVMNDRDWYYEDARLHQDMKEVLEEGYKLLEIKNVFENPKYVGTNNGERLSFEQRHEMDMIRVTYRQRVNNHIIEVYRYSKILLEHLYFYKVKLLTNPKLKTIRKMDLETIDSKIIEFHTLIDKLILLEKSMNN